MFHEMHPFFLLVGLWPSVKTLVLNGGIVGMCGVGWV